MLPAAVNAPSPECLHRESVGELLDAYLAYLAAAGRANITSIRAARVFLWR